MSDYFLLRGRRALLREVSAAWLSLTVGTLIFAYFAARFEPRMGEGAAFTAALILAIPISAMLLQSVRTGRLSFALPALPKPVDAKTKAEAGEDDDFKEFVAFWQSLAPDEREGLRYLTGLVGANILGAEIWTPFGREMKTSRHLLIDEKHLLALDENALMSGPDEFTISISGHKYKAVTVKVDKARRMISYTFKASEELPGSTRGATDHANRSRP
jgi:hypothetical protein